MKEEGEMRKVVGDRFTRPPVVGDRFTSPPLAHAEKGRWKRGGAYVEAGGEPCDFHGAKNVSGTRGSCRPAASCHLSYGESRNL